jgi:hypothetical protein
MGTCAALALRATHAPNPRRNRIIVASRAVVCISIDGEHRLMQRAADTTSVDGRTGDAPRRGGRFSWEDVSPAMVPSVNAVWSSSPRSSSYSNDE